MATVARARAVISRSSRTRHVVPVIECDASPTPYSCATHALQSELENSPWGDCAGLSKTPLYQLSLPMKPTLLEGLYEYIPRRYVAHVRSISRPSIHAASWTRVQPASRAGVKTTAGARVEPATRTGVEASPRAGVHPSAWPDIHPSTWPEIHASTWPNVCAAARAYV